MLERRHQMTRIEAGEYLLPSNDGQTLWRITKFEDIDNRKYWSAWRWRGPLTEAQRVMNTDPDSFLEWHRWEEWSSFCYTRKAAIEDALTYELVAR